MFRSKAWLRTTAKNRALNAVRRARMVDRKHETIGHEIATHVRLVGVVGELMLARAQRGDSAVVLTDRFSTKAAVDPVRVRLELKEADDALDFYEIDRSIVRHAGSAVMMAVDRKKRVLLVRPELHQLWVAEGLLAADQVQVQGVVVGVMRKY